MSYVRRFWAPAVGIAAIVVGVLIMRSAPAVFGWFAYAPLADTAFVPPFMTWEFVAGAVITALGLALVAGWIGYRIGRRRHPDAA